jgi:hypothetical protein
MPQFKPQLRIELWRATTCQRPSIRLHTSVSRKAFDRLVWCRLAICE